MLDKIYILAKGPSWYRCPETVPPNTEIWGCNSTYKDRKLDKLFIMHDIRLDMIYEDEDFVEHVNGLGIPVYTTGLYKVLKNNRSFPVAEVYNEFRIPYLLNVICYMLAYAITQKPKEIELCGVDMRAGVEYIGEKGCVEFWVGVAVGRGIKVNIPNESMVCKDIMPRDVRARDGDTQLMFYGYMHRTKDNGLVQLIPRGERKCASKYKLVPVGEEEE